MSLHKLTAGDGYQYLTRQVAAQDATHRGRDGLTAYYTERGESPGVWLGRGTSGLSGFDAAGLVSEAQMVALFGEGRHPDAELIEARMLTAGHGAPAVLAATRLGSPYRIAAESSEFRVELARRFAAANDAAGRPNGAAVPEAERASIRTQLGREVFAERYGRPPADARELSGLLAREGRQQTTAVAGYDLTFTPVKSVSALWAVAPTEVAQTVERCHTAAVEQTLTWLEEQAAYTRLGRNGVRQVDTRGLIAAAFVHRDSRAGDPNLHTHVAVSNKVQAAGGEADGRWLALDGRPLHQLAVAASERYNTRIEALLVDRLGVQFTERPGEAGKRPVREIVGIDPHVATAWSARRAAIDVRRAELATRFQAEHGRPPTPVEAIKLAQQATLQTRQAKHEPRSLAEQRTAWHRQAIGVLGSPRAVTAMVDGVLDGRHQSTRLHPQAAGADNPVWMAETSQTVLAAVQSARATWQQAHVRAEAERQVRTAGPRLTEVDGAVERVVDAVLSPARSVPLGVPEPVSEPGVLRRRDGSSVYTRAGSQLFTSAAIMDAEAQLLSLAAQDGGRQASEVVVGLALLESAANGIALNAGQAQLVSAMATSGGRLQLALAPAGTGKTTAMRVLARAWTGDGGTVVGLAPSAAAAAVLSDALGARADTLAKLLWSIDTLESHRDSPSGQQLSSVPTAGPGGRGPVPDWVRRVGPGTLVVLDEAGMAGTIDLARAATWITGRGASLRLIGDDNQLAAVGAGGILRDLAERPGALTLTGVVRFEDPAEAAASLALRAGDPAAAGFYIDHGRVHVGDLDTSADAAYRAWQADRAAGRDALLLAPTRQVATELNARARADRLTALAASGTGTRLESGTDTAPSAQVEVRLVDGTCASAGDTIVTRRNDRQLVISRTDWVKNGDRFTVRDVLPGGSLRAVHLQTGLAVLLPVDYTREHVALGYASTVHTAQGSTAQVCHTVATGSESRQLLYVAMTRGRAENHLYLSTASDGDEHRALTPDGVRPPTAVDLLTRILGRDDATRSATTTARELDDPAVRLGPAADRYVDSLHVAAANRLGPDGLRALDLAAETVLPGLSAAPAWPTLQHALALLAVDGTDPAVALQAAIERAGLVDAADPAAVLHWRLDTTRPTAQRHDVPGTDNDAAVASGPLPWLPPIPAGLADDPTWGGYLHARHTHTTDLARQVADRAGAWRDTDAPAWATALVHVGADTDLLAELAVWRAANSVEDIDARPTGPHRLPLAEARHQRRLDTAVTTALGSQLATAGRWRQLAASVEPRLLDDPFWPQLADRLGTAHTEGVDIHGLVRVAAAQGPLPDEMPAAALWWRLSRDLAITTPGRTEVDREDADIPAAATREEAPERPGLGETGLLTSTEPVPSEVATSDTDRTAGLEEGTATLSMHPPLLGQVRSAPTDPDTEEDRLAPPAEQLEGATASAPHAAASDPARVDGSTAGPDRAPADVAAAGDAPDWLIWAPECPQTIGQTRLWQPTGREDVPPARLRELNSQAAAFYSDAYPGSWAAAHLQQRLGTDLHGDPRFTPGYAPAGWTHLVEHLHALGASDQELLAGGLASTARTGRLVDRFRDRLVLPIRNDAGIVGFIARRHPDLPDGTPAGPKYLNTADNSLFHKGAQLYGLTEGAEALAAGAVPVLVEGPIDAIAVALATDGTAVGVAPLGTALTDPQADSLRPYLHAGGPGVVVATDNDIAGRKAAERAYWKLVARRGDPRHLQLPEGTDPAELLAARGPQALRDALVDPPPLARSLVDARVAAHADRLHTAEGTVIALRAVAQVIGALPPEQWPAHIDHLQSRLDIAPGSTHLEVLDAGQAWTADPSGRARQQLQGLAVTAAVESQQAAAVRPAAARTHSAGASGPQPLELATQPAEAWRDLGRAIDPRLIAGTDWPGLAAGLERASRAGYDVHSQLPRLVARSPLPDLRPARALHYRLVDECPAAIPPSPGRTRPVDEPHRPMPAQVPELARPAPGPRAVR